MGERKKGGQPGNRNRAKGEYPRRVISLSGPEYDAAMERLVRRGNSNPTDKEVVREMSELDWAQFDLRLSDADAAKIDCESEMRKLRADYRWIKDCEKMSIESLKEVVEGKEEDYQSPLNLRRHRQAKIVLEAREKRA